MIERVLKPSDCRQLLYHLHPRNHHKWSPRFLCKIFQHALQIGSICSPKSLTFLWKKKEFSWTWALHRMTESETYAGWKGPPEVCGPTPAWSRSRAGWSASHLWEHWMPPEMEIPQLLWVPVSVYDNLMVKNYFPLYLGGISWGLTCAYWVLSCCCAPLRRDWLHLLCTFPAGDCRWQYHLPFTLLRLTKSESTSISLYILYSNPLNILMTLCWTCSRMPLPLLYGNPHSCTGRSVTDVSPQCWVEGKDHLCWPASNTQRAHWWLMVNLSTPDPFLQRCCRSSWLSACTAALHSLSWHLLWKVYFANEELRWYKVG